MENVMQRLERLEAQWVVLSEENGANKVTIKILENKLLESAKKNRELTGKGATLSVQNADDVKIHKRVRGLEKKMIKLEHQQQQQIQDMNEKFGKVDKLQNVFNGAILKRASANDKFERLSSRMDSVSDAVDDFDSFKTKPKETQQAQIVPSASPMKSQSEGMKSVMRKKIETKQAQAVSAATSKEFQDSQIERKFKSCMTRVKDRNVPLSLGVYCELSALESIASIPNGPAFQFVTNWHGNIKTAYFQYRRGHIKKFHTKGINTKLTAMTEYVKLCDQHTCKNHLDDTQYHLVYIGMSYHQRILAMDSCGLRFLDPTTKENSQSWSWNEINTCRINVHGIVVLTKTGGPSSWFNTLEKINPQVYASIGSFIWD